MTRRIALVGVVLLGAAWMAWRFLPTAGSPRFTPVRDNDALLEGAGGVLPHRATDSGAVSRAASPLGPRSFVETAPVAATRPNAPAPHILKVLFEPEAQPAAGATVDAIVFDDISIRGRTRWQEFTTVNSTEFVADREGVVRLPQFADLMFVRARCTGRSAERLIRAEQSESHLSLRLPISVVVVDQAGAPQGHVPVAVFDASEVALPMQRGVTSGDGLATLALPNPGPWDDETDRAELRRCAVAIALPLAERVEKRFDGRSRLPMPIELVLPPTGTLIVNLVTAEGKAFTEPATVSLTSPRDDNPRFRDTAFDDLFAKAENGRATFSMVPLGGDLVVRAIPSNRALHEPTLKLAEPRQAGADTSVSLTCGNLAVLIRGRVVDAGGNPFRAFLDAWLPDTAGEDSHASTQYAEFAKAGANGHFELRFDLDPGSVTASDLELDVTVVRETGAGRSPAEQHRFKVKLPAEVRNGSADVGDFMIPDTELIAAGVVFDSDDSPVQGASLRVGSLVESSCGVISPEIRGRSNDDGRFELRGILAREWQRLCLSAQRDGWISTDATPFTRGATDVKVVVTRAGGIAGSIAATEAESSWVLSLDSPVRIEITGPDGFAGEPPIENGVFKHERLLAGTYSVRITAPGSEEPLFEVPGLVVTPGKINRDPRLQNVDLGKLMTSWVVTVKDEQAKPIRNARVVAFAEGRAKNRLMEAWTDPEGRVTIITRPVTVDILVAAKGYRAFTRVGVKGDLMAILRKSAPLTVTVELEEPVQSPPSRHVLSTRIVWICDLHEEKPERPDDGWDDPRTEEFTLHPFGANHQATISVDNPGVYEVRAYLEPDGPRGLATLDQDGGSSSVRVTENGAASIRIKVSAEAMRKAIEELKKE